MPDDHDQAECRRVAAHEAAHAIAAIAIGSEEPGEIVVERDGRGVWHGSYRCAKAAKASAAESPDGFYEILERMHNLVAAAPPGSLPMPRGMHERLVVTMAGFVFDNEVARLSDARARSTGDWQSAHKQAAIFATPSR